MLLCAVLGFVINAYASVFIDWLRLGICRLLFEIYLSFLTITCTFLPNLIPLDNNYHITGSRGTT